MSQVGRYLTNTGIPIVTITGNAGGPVPADGAGNIGFTGLDPIDVTGFPLLNSLLITVATATTAQIGVTTLATNAETIAGVVNSKAVVPSGLAAKLGTQTVNAVPYGGGTANAINWMPVGTNGQVIIGATGAAPQFATLASAGGTITFTPGVNTLNMEAHAADVNQQNIIYVGKHGNDANDGLNENKAKLTFGSAITAAFAIAPAAVVCFDEGTYVENLTGRIGVDIFAPNATIQGAHTAVAANHWVFQKVIVLTATSGFSFNSAGNTVRLDISLLEAQGTGIGFLCIAGSMNVSLKRATLVDGALFAIAATDKVNFSFQDIHISGTATLIGCGAAAQIYGTGNHVTDAGAGTLFTVNAAANVALIVSGVVINTLSNVSAAANVRLTAGYMAGALLESGAGAVDAVCGTTRIDGVPIGAQIRSTGAFTTLGANSTVTFTGGVVNISADLTDNAVNIGTGANAGRAVAIGNITLASSLALKCGTGGFTLASASGNIISATAAGVITLLNDLDVTEGGTGVSTLTSHGILMGNGAGDIQATAEPSDGQLLIGRTGNFPVLASLTAGAGITVTPGAGTITIAAPGTGMTWTREAGAAVAVANDHGYINTNVGLTTFTLPAVCAVGDEFAIMGESAAGWTIAQNAGQNIQIGAVSTTGGVGGSLASSNRYDGVHLICRVANTTFQNVEAPQGNLTIV